MALRSQANNGASAGTTSLSASLTGVVAGDLLVVTMTERDGTSIASLSVTSDLDGAFTQVVTRAVSARRVWIGARMAATSGTHVITVSWTPSVVFDFSAQAYDTASSATADASNSTGGAATTSHTFGTVTPSATAIVVGCWGDGADYGSVATGPDDGMTLLTVNASSQTRRQLYAYVTGRTGATDGAFTTANSVARDACIAAFLESAGGGGNPYYAYRQQG